MCKISYRIIEMNNLNVFDHRAQFDLTGWNI
jgi:hypothetical protein